MCPFSINCPKGWLGEDRAQNIIAGIVDNDGTFYCHKTLAHDEDGEPVMSTDKKQHCAGAMSLLVKIDRPNQRMRIALRLGMLDIDAIDNIKSTFNDQYDFINHHTV